MPELIVKLKDRELSRVPIMKVTTRVGRDEVNDVVIDNQGVSRTHAVVRYDGGFVVTDAGSSNGIFVNGHKADEWRLSNGDEIQIGKFTVLFSAGGGVAPERLARDAVLDAPRPPARSRNPLQTCHLTSDELQRFMRSLGKGPAGVPSEPDAASRTIDPSPGVVVAAGARQPRPAPPPLPDGQAHFRRDLMDGSDPRARAFRNLSITLGLVALALAGLVAYLLLAG